MRTSVKRTGLTLIELILVVAILAVLAMIVLPKMDGLQSNANHAVGANSAADTIRYIQTYRVMKNRLPDYYDSLMDGNNLWAAANPSTNTPGLHTSLSGSAAKLTTYDLTADDVTGLQAAGIYTLLNLGTTNTSLRPSDRFNTEAPIASGTKVAIVNTASSGGKKMIDHVYRDNLKASGTSGALPAGRQLMAVGFGPHNKLIGSFMIEAPLYPNVDHNLVYGRNIVLFEIGGTGRAVLKAVTGADGDLLDDLTTYISKEVK